MTPHWATHVRKTTTMGIVKLLRILGAGAVVLHSATNREWDAANLAQNIEDDPSSEEAAGEFTIANGYVYRVVGGFDSIARKPFAQILQGGDIKLEDLNELDEGGQLWRELKKLCPED